jgi:hypothetical protein
MADELPRRPVLREVDIKPERDKRCDEVIEKLKLALERAEAGELLDVMIFAEMEGNRFLVSYTQAYDARERLGAMEMIKADWLRQCWSD